MAFTNSRANKTGPRARRLFYGFSLICCCAVAAGCGAPPDAGQAVGNRASAASVIAGPLEQIQQASVYCPDTVMCTTSVVATAASTSKTKEVLTGAKDLAAAVGDAMAKNPGKSVSDVLQFVQDIFFASSTPNLEGDINCVNQEIQCIAQGLDWHITDLTWEQMQYTPVISALTDMKTGYTTGPGDDNDSHDGTFGSGQIDMFSRVYVGPSATAGDGQWMNIISPSTPTPTQDGLVLDWQAGLTRFMTLIPMRLAVMAYLDPNFQHDGTRTAELDGAGVGYRPLLQGWLSEMENGVKCDWVDRGADGEVSLESTLSRYSHTDIACADVNTGISAESTYTIPDASNCNVCGAPPYDYECVTDLSCLQSQPSYIEVLLSTDPLKRQVKAQMPIFEVHSMIDSLYRTTYPAPDLTEVRGRIPVTSNHGLCLDVQWANPATGTPVWIWNCNGTSAQQWSYNRQLGTITNTAFGKCLQVRQKTVPLFGGKIDDNSEGAVAEISDCISSPVPLRQQWTYDPEKGMIRSALGTVLDIQSGNLQAGTPVVLMDDLGLPSELSEQSWYADRTKGDSTGDGLSDIRLAGAAWGNIPVAENQGGGFFYSNAWPVDVPDFVNVWATSPNVKALAGDFDGDGRADVALTGVSVWSTIPVAFAKSDSTFSVTNNSLDWPDFASWAAAQNVSAVTGDFNGDGRTDVALTGGAGWWTIPVAFSNGDGSFHVMDQSVDTTFNSYAVMSGARPVTGDFNGDGLSDIAIVGGTPWNEIPVALSNGDGNFTFELESVGAGDTNFTSYATQPGVQVVSGDFNGDGLGDIALTGGSGWGNMPVAFSTNGGFSVPNSSIIWGDGGFPTYASWAGVQAVAGDFNKDGKSDIALTGGAGWGSIPVAYSIGDGTWGVTNVYLQGGNFPAEAATAGVSAVGGAY